MKTKKSVINDNFKYTLISILLGFLFGAIILMISKLNPIIVYKELFIGIFSKPSFIMWSIVYSTPIMLTGLAFAFANKTGLFNIGIEGQYIMGAMVATLVGVFVNAPFYIHIPLTILAGCLAGMAWGALVGFLKITRGVNEVVSSIMLNWTAFYISNFVVTLSKFNLNGEGSETSKKIQATAQIGLTNGWIENFFSTPEAFEIYRANVREFFGPRANFGIIIAIVTVFVINYILFKTKYGFSLRAVGSNKNAAEYAGIDIKKSILLSMGISGLLAGMAGALHVMGSSNQISVLATPENYGFDGIAVALIGFMSPIGVIFSALFFGSLKYGGTKLSIIGAPAETVNIVIGFIIYAIATSNAIKMLLNNLTKKRSEKNE
jgi:general nucleoside transport system permease protein